MGTLLSAHTVDWMTPPRHRERRWTTSQMMSRTNWQLGFPPGTGTDLAILKEWSRSQSDPIAAYTGGIAHLPAVQELARQIQHELKDSGVAWVRGIPTRTEQDTLRLFYLALGFELGSVFETYGRLYDVTDRGGSYRNQSIPVSQTREATGMHTDSSARDVEPDYVGLLCLQPARSGGGSRLASAMQVHEELREHQPENLAILYREFVRDLVTPGSDRDPSRIATNRFPIFSQAHGSLTFRYMRYWIEKGHERIQRPLDCEEVDALDTLDRELARPDHILQFHLDVGDMLWIDNRVVAHDREAYEDDPAQPRLLVRMWVGSKILE
jgi:alpha-ketoglutarate-dependent taurine dioxygenase